LSPEVGVRAACRELGRAPASYYRQQQPAVPKVETPRQPDPRSLSEVERQSVVEVLHSERFVDEAPATIWATLLDEGRYLCSVRTMYRLLAGMGEARDRRRQATHPARVKPELVAVRPNQVWSWDITKLLGPQKWTYYYLYVVLDIFSRYVVGWMLAPRESGLLAEQLFAETIRKQGVDRDQLTLHADNGSSMISKPLAFLLADLGVTKSHSRPHVSNDNPYSEAHFKTLKYRPEFPDRFGVIEEARAYCREFFRWYNQEHRHSGLGYHTPANVHHGVAASVHAQRSLVLADAYAAHPERFPRQLPQPLTIPTVAWINQPQTAEPNGDASAH
jgi:putative transposase